MNSNLILRWRGGYVKKKEVDCDPNAVRVRHLVEFLRGEKAVDSSCSNGDLLCFALHMIMRDSGYQPTVSTVVMMTPSSMSSKSHSFSYSLSDCPSVLITMTYSTTADTSYISFCAVAELCDVESKSCQISLQVQDYTKQHPIVWRKPRDVLINTAQLVMLVKDQLAHRLLTNIHRALGIKETGTLTSLPQELQLAVMQYLNARSLLALSATCRLMQSLALDHFLWKSLLNRVFLKGRLPDPRTVLSLRKRTNRHLLLELYKDEHKQCQERMKKHMYGISDISYGRPFPWRPSSPTLLPVTTHPSYHHGRCKLPLTPPPQSKFRYLHSRGSNRSVLFINLPRPYFVCAGNDGYFEYFNDNPLRPMRRSHSFPAFPSDKWRCHWSDLNSLHGLGY